jgi:hypothetical protein
VTVTNTGTGSTTGWTVTLNFPNGQTISQLWQGRITVNSNPYTVINETYNNVLGAGQSTVFGFNGGHGGTNNPPALTCSRTP